MTERFRLYLLGDVLWYATDDPVFERAIRRIVVHGVFHAWDGGSLRRFQWAEDAVYHTMAPVEAGK